MIDDTVTGLPVKHSVYQSFIAESNYSLCLKLHYLQYIPDRVLIEANKLLTQTSSLRIVPFAYLSCFKISTIFYRTKECGIILCFLVANTNV
jgi:hypothetical protein